MDRQVLVDGAKNGNAADLSNINSAQGHILTYDKNGNRTSDTSYGQQITTEQRTLYNGNDVPVGATTVYVNHEGNITEHYTYDKANRLSKVATGAFDNNLNPLGPEAAITLDRRLYDAAGRLIRSGPGGTLSNDYIAALNAGGSTDANGASTRVTRYDADGRVTVQHTTKPDGSFDSDMVYRTDTSLPQGSSYDAAGNAHGYQVTDNVGVTSIYTIDVQKADGYRQASITGVRSDNPGQTGTTTQHYDANGFLTGITDSQNAANNRTLVNDAQGRVLYKEQTGHVLKQLVVNGQVYGTYGLGADAGNSANFTNQTNFNPTYQPITGSYPDASTGLYTVRSGDTLQSIAQAAYGDSAQWYLIADANGLQGNSDLRVGQTLNIPSRVGSVHNTGSDFRPYDPSKIVGSTTPTLPMPQSSGGGCGGLGQIIMIVVAAAAAYFTIGAALSSLGTATTATGTALTGTAATSAVAAGTASWTAGSLVTAGAIGGAVGSVASQLVGNALGVVDGFSWKAIALAAIGGAVGGGMQAVAGGTGPLSGGGFGATMARAAIGNALTQGIGVATGLQDKFSWKNVAASAVGAGVGSVVSQALGITDSSGMKTSAFKNADFGERLIKSALTGLAAGTATAVMRGGRVSVQQIALDAFGNALGQAVVDQASQPEQRSPLKEDAQTFVNAVNGYSAQDSTHPDEPIVLADKKGTQDLPPFVSDAGERTAKRLTSLLVDPATGNSSFAYTSKVQQGLIPVAPVLGTVDGLEMRYRSTVAVEGVETLYRGMSLMEYTKAAANQGGFEPFGLRSYMSPSLDYILGLEAGTANLNLDFSVKVKYAVSSQGFVELRTGAYTENSATESKYPDNPRWRDRGSVLKEDAITLKTETVDGSYRSGAADTGVAIDLETQGQKVVNIGVGKNVAAKVKATMYGWVVIDSSSQEVEVGTAGKGVRYASPNELRLQGGLNVVGKGLTVVAVGADLYRMGNAINSGDSGKIVATGVDIAGGWAGAWAGSKFGAAAFGAAGCLTPAAAIPFVCAASPFVGGVVGGLAGYKGVSWGASTLYNYFKR